MDTRLRVYMAYLKVIEPGKVSQVQFPRFFYANDDQDAKQEAVRLRDQVKQWSIASDPKTVVKVDRIFHVREVI